MNRLEQEQLDALAYEIKDQHGEALTWILGRLTQLGEDVPLPTHAAALRDGATTFLDFYKDPQP